MNYCLCSLGAVFKTNALLMLNQDYSVCGHNWSKGQFCIEYLTTICNGGQILVHFKWRKDHIPVHTIM